MAIPWKTLETVETDEGPLELRQRGEKDFLLTIDGRVLMSSMAHHSEVALSELAIEQLQTKERPAVLISGLGMGYTLRAALDLLPERARVAIAEINPIVVRWCRGPMASLTDSSLSDPRVTVLVEDVAEIIARTADAGPKEKFDAILLDLYMGPNDRIQGAQDPFYGPRALRLTRKALSRHGVFAIWSEDPDHSFERRLRSCGFSVQKHRAGHGGRRHVVYIATPDAMAGPERIGTARPSPNASRTARPGDARTPKGGGRPTTGGKSGPRKKTRPKKAEKKPLPIGRRIQAVERARKKSGDSDG